MSSDSEASTRRETGLKVAGVAGILLGILWIVHLVAVERLPPGEILFDLLPPLLIIYIGTRVVLYR